MELKISQRNKTFLFLFIILGFSALLRFWNIQASDVITDESSLGFRAIGLIDFDAAHNQSTPWEWRDPPPLWMRASFHDHPPLFFWIQHLSIKIFGENTMGLRFPSALFGIAAIFLLWALAKELFGEKVANITALFAAINTYLLLISRIGLQESAVIFFMLLSMYFFFLAQKIPKFYLAFGASLGLALLTKYTSFILVPILFSSMAPANKKEFREKFLWYGLGIAAIIFSPVIIYNILLFKNFGHFDFQFSYIFGQNAPQWHIQPGKEEFTSIYDTFFHYFINLFQGAGFHFILIFAISFLFLLFQIRRRKKGAIFLLLGITWLFLLYLFIGPSQRFLAMTIPFIIIAGAFTWYEIYKKKTCQNVMCGFFSAFLIFEMLFSFASNNIFKSSIHASAEIQKNYSLSGYNELDQWIQDATQNTMPQYTFPFQYEFLNTLSKNVMTEYEERKAKPLPALFVYDEDMNEASALWVMHRQLIYHNWPVLSTIQYKNLIEKNGKKYFHAAGVEKIYFIQKTERTLGKKFSKPEYGAQSVLDKEPLKKSIASIKNKDGNDAFIIYEIFYKM